MQVHSVTVRVSGVKDTGNRQVAVIVEVTRNDRTVAHGAHSDVADWVQLDAVLGAVGDLVYAVETDVVVPHLIGPRLQESLEYAERSPF